MRRSSRIRSLRKLQERKNLFNDLIADELGLIIRYLVEDFTGLNLVQAESNREIVAAFRANHMSQHFLEVLNPKFNRLT